MGTRENIASAKIRIDAKVAQRFADKTEDDRAEIRDVACGNSKATKMVSKNNPDIICLFLSTGTLPGADETFSECSDFGGTDGREMPASVDDVARKNSSG
jgi:hypothetical protein